MCVCIFERGWFNSSSLCKSFAQLSYKKINNNLFITVNNNNDNLKSIIHELHTSLKSVLFYFSFLKYMTRCELQVCAVTFQHTEAYPGLK